MDSLVVFGWFGGCWCLVVGLVVCVFFYLVCG